MPFQQHQGYIPLCIIRILGQPFFSELHFIYLVVFKHFDKPFYSYFCASFNGSISVFRLFGLFLLHGSVFSLFILFTLLFLLLNHSLLGSLLQNNLVRECFQVLFDLCYFKYVLSLLLAQALQVFRWSHSLTFIIINRFPHSKEFLNSSMFLQNIELFKMMV